MPRIENIEMEDLVADSLLADDNIIAVLPHQGNLHPQDTGSDAERGDSVFDNPDDYFAEAISEQEHDRARYGDAAIDALEHQEQGRQPREQETAEQEQPEAAQREQEQPERQEQAQEASQPLTPEAIREGMEGLSTFVAAHQLNQGESAATFPHELCAAFGTTPQASGMNPQEAIDFSSKAVAAGLREFELCGGDFSKLSQMPDELAFASGFQWAKALGYNPQDPKIDLRGIGRVTRQGTLSILQAINAGYAEPEQINAPDQIKWFAGELQKNLGSQRQIPYEMARAFCNAYAKRVAGVVNQLRQNQQATAQPDRQPDRQPRRSGQRVPARFREGVKGSKAPRFQTNQDIFSGNGFQAALTQNL
jgi:hypothetical protein